MWVPPSTVLMLFAKARTFSVYESLYWRATSIVGRAVPALGVDRARVERLLVPVEVADEGDEPALEVERSLAVDPLVDAA